MVKKKPGMSDLNVVEACLVENYNDKWILIQKPLIMFVTFCSGSNKVAASIKDKRA